MKKRTQCNILFIGFSSVPSGYNQHSKM